MSFLYAKGIQNIGENNIDLVADEIRVQPVAVGSGAYIPSETADNAFDDIPAAARIGTPFALVSKTFNDGVFDAADIVGITNTTYTRVDALVIYKYNATESLAYLVAYIDSGAAFPYYPAGANIPVYWSDGSNKIFRIDGSP